MSTEKALRQIAKKVNIIRPGDTARYAPDDLLESILEQIDIYQENDRERNSAALEDLKAISTYYRERLAIIFKILLRTDRSMDNQLVQTTQMVESMLRDRESVRFFYPLEDDPDAELFNVVDLKAQVEALETLKAVREVVEEILDAPFLARERGYGEEERDNRQKRLWNRLIDLTGARLTCSLCGTHYRKGEHHKC